MSSTHDHQSFSSSPRRSQPLCNQGCQTVLYKAVFEHFTKLRNVGALLVASKSFQNSSLGANFLVTFAVQDDTIDLLESVLSPSSCFSMQFVPTLYIKHSWPDAEKIKRITNFVGEIVKAKYLDLSLRSLALDSVTSEVLSCFFGSSRNVWPQLQDLSLESCHPNDEHLEHISKNAAQLRSVNLSENSGIADIGLEHLSKLSGITSLDLSGCNKITNVSLEHISKFSGITSLNIRECKLITDAGLDHVSNLSGITSLILCGCSKITDVGLGYVAKLSGIKCLNLRACHLITDAGIEHISSLSYITSLDLFICKLITDAAIDHISKLSRLTNLGLYGCHEITDSGLQRLSELSSITSLDLAYCDVTDACLEHISVLSGITSLNLDTCTRITDAGLAHISKLSNMTSLTLCWCNEITAEARTRLKAALPNCGVN